MPVPDPVPAPVPAPDPATVPAASLARALGVVGDVWTIVIIKEMFLGTRRFQHFCERLHIPRQTLVVRLAAMCDAGLIYRRPALAGTSGRGYALTPKGLDMYPFVLAIWAWHRRWRPDTSFLPRRLGHRICGAALDPQFCCRACDREASVGTVTIAAGEGAGCDPRPVSRHSRQNELALRKQDRAGETAIATSIVGDRWSNLVLDALLRDVRGFDPLIREIGISPNILAGRLRRLGELGLVTAAKDGRRVRHDVTPPGRDFWPVIQSLSDWGDRWLAGKRGAPRVTVHACGGIAEPYWRCRGCGGAVRPWDVDVIAGALMKPVGGTVWTIS